MRRSSRIIIERVYPEIDGGRYPAKRIAGETLAVEADIFMDGHDALRAELAYRQNGEKSWRTVPMVLVENDRWRAQVSLPQIGRLSYAVHAWPDQYGSWVNDTRKKREAGQDIALELQEGRQLMEQLLTGLKGEKRKQMQLRIDSLLEGESEALADNLFGEEALAFMHAHAPRTGEAVYKTLEVLVERQRAQFSAWYELFPRSQAPLGSLPRSGGGSGRGDSHLASQPIMTPTQPSPLQGEGLRSGTFADCEARLPDIQAMGFDVAYFPPIHPIGKTFRKGRNNTLNATADDVGSPYAIGAESGGHKDVHPDLGTLADFRHFVQAANKLGMDVALDFAIQCSPDHPYIKEHPEWFRFRPDGSIRHAENPPKKYQDIVNVDFESTDAQALWEELRSIVLFWIEQGVTIFRVDNPHTKPFAFWEWLIGSIHEQRPDIIFLAEAFTRPKIMHLLAKAGFTQSYSYFTWRNSKVELTQYLTELTTTEVKDYFRPNFFPTTPDILPAYLQTGGRPGFIIRLALAATLSSNYGMLAGYELCEGEALPGKEEYADSERFELRPRDWQAPGNIRDFVTRLNHIRHENPALQQMHNLRFCTIENEQMLFYCKWSQDKKNIVFVVVNLDPHNMQEGAIELPLYAFGMDANMPYTLDDLLLGHSWSWTGARQFQHLEPQKNPIAIFRIHAP